MDRSCYRCGAQVEEHTTFCPSCGAPQIRVAAPLAANLPVTPPLPQDAPDSLQPPVVPLHGPVGRIQWRRFWRIALPLAVIGGLTTAFLPLGVLLFLLSIVLAVRRYRRDHVGPLMASQGMRMGAVIGLVSYIVLLIIEAIYGAEHFGEFRQQWDLSLQKAAGNADPMVQQFAHWAASDQGMLVLIPIFMVITLIFVLLLSGIVGALAVVLTGNRRG